MDGLLVIDKPAGITSHDVVARVRKLLGTRRVGHGGTLDPDATGVLLVTVGQATRFFPYLSKEAKTYEGAVRLGVATDTYDASGAPDTEERRDLPGREELEKAMRAFEGEILQTPPAYSAKKIGGEPGYKLARARKEVRFEPVKVRVERFGLLDYRPPFVHFETACSSGTYVRALAHDLGLRLGCGGHLARLRRTSVGPYSLQDAAPLEALEEAAGQGRAGSFVRPLESLLPGAPSVVASPEAEVGVRNGSPLGRESVFPARPDDPAFPTGTSPWRIQSVSGRLLALAKPSPDGARLLPFLVLR